jgi:hypothetical protein
MGTDAIESGARTGAPGKRSRRRTIARLALAVVIFALGLELALRALLFGGGFLVRVGKPLRRAGLYADQDTEEQWWTLSATFGDIAAREIVSPGFDPVLGWLSPDFDPKTYRHVPQRRDRCRARGDLAHARGIRFGHTYPRSTAHG